MKKNIALMVALGCIGASAASVNYDLLGRKGSKMNSPMVYKNVDYSKVKKNEQQKVGSSLENRSLARLGTGLTGDAVAVQGIYNNHGSIVGEGGLKYYAVDVLLNNGQHKKAASDVFFSKGGIYPDFLMNRFISLNFGHVQADDFNLDEHTCDSYENSTSYTQTECPWITRTNPNEYKFETPMVTVNNTAASPYEYNTQIHYVPKGTVRDDANYSHRSYITEWYYENRPYTQLPYPTVNDWNYVGVYMNSDALPVSAHSFDNTVYYRRYSPVGNFSTKPKQEMIATRAYDVLKSSSKYSTVYVGSNRPSSPASQSPQIYMGLHIKKSTNDNSSETNQYTNAAKELDNYIYNYRTTEIVAAGNFGTHQSSSNPGTGYLAEDALAANAITVGAVDAYTKKITNYSSYYSTAYYGAGKPEIYNFSHFYVTDLGRKYTKKSNGKVYNYNPYYDGTETAAAYTAGMVSDLLATNPFYRWHPEVVKAAVITSSHIDINTPYPSTYMTKMPSYKCLVTINQDKSRSGMGTANAGYALNFCNHESRYWIGPVANFFTRENPDDNNRKELRFSVKRSAEKHNVVAAIAWLSSGNDIAQFNRIPQDIDLYAYENNTANVDNINIANWIDYSASVKSYEKVSFTTNAEYITFRIVFWGEEATAENNGQVVLGFDMASY